MGEDTDIMRINGIPPLTVGPGVNQRDPCLHAGRGAPVPAAGLNTSYGPYVEGQTDSAGPRSFDFGHLSYMIGIISTTDTGHGHQARYR
jgi:hypothetical protein